MTNLSKGLKLRITDQKENKKKKKKISIFLIKTNILEGYPLPHLCRKIYIYTHTQ